MKIVFLLCFYVFAAQGSEHNSELKLSEQNLSKLLDDYEDAKIVGNKESHQTKAIKNEILKRLNNPANKADIQKYVDPQKIERFTIGSSVTEFTRAAWDAHERNPAIKGQGAHILVLDDGKDHQKHVKDTVRQIAPLADVKEGDLCTKVPDFSTYNAVNLSMGGLSFNDTIQNIDAILKSKPLLVHASGNDSCFLNQLCNAHNSPLKTISAEQLKLGYIPVGALEYGNMISSFSNKPGHDPLFQENFVWTLGSDVLANVNGKNMCMTGTSMATPIVTGTAALISGAYGLEKDNIKTAILNSAKQDFIVQNSEIKVMVYVEKGLSESSEFNDKDGYLHIHQPYHAYIWGKGILDVEGALKYAEILKKYPNNIENEWKAYLFNKKKTEKHAAKKIQVWYKNLNSQNQKSQTSSKGDMHHWLHEELPIIDTTTAHKLLMVYQMNSPVLSKMVLKKYMKKAINNSIHDLSVKAFLLKISLDLIEYPDESYQNFALDNIKKLLENDPVDKKNSLLWKRILTTGPRNFFSQIIDTQNSDLINFILTKYPIIQTNIINPLKGKKDPGSIIDLRKQSLSMNEDQSPFDKDLEESLKYHSLHWNTTENIQKLKAWIDLGLPIESEDVIHRIQHQVFEANHMRIGWAFLDTQREVKESDIFIKPGYKSEELLTAYSLSESSEKIDRLLKFVDLDTQNKDENTLLHLAIQKNDTLFATRLINLGSRVDFENKEKKTPLNLLFEKYLPNKTSAWENIVKSKKILSEVNTKLKSLLMKFPSLKDIMTYISYGANPSTVGIWTQAPNYASGNTPLSIAIQEGDIQAIKVLIEKGANPYQKYQIPETCDLEKAILTARTGNYAVVKELLKSHKTDKIVLNDLLDQRALLMDNLELSLILIEGGADVNIITSYSRSPLYLAAIIKKDKEAVQKLMSHKDINLDMQYFGKTVKDLLEEEIKENPEDEISKEILKILQSPEHK